MQIPDFMPVLARGSHPSPKDGACFMEMASFLAGEQWSDHPACTNPVIAQMARCVNDRLSDRKRQKLAVLIPSAMGTAFTGSDMHQKLQMAELVAWCVGRVRDTVSPLEFERLHLDELVSSMVKDCTNPRLRLHEVLGYADAAVGCAARMFDIYEADQIGLLTGLIAKYDRMTGRTAPPAVEPSKIAALNTHLETTRGNV